MELALEEARKAKHLDEVPVGAVVVRDNVIIGRGQNQTISSHDPTAHAEISAIREACLFEKNYRLSGSDLYVTLEPCVMCLGAAIHARVKRLFFGALDPKSGALSSVLAFPFEQGNHKIEINGGFLEAKCGNILKEFFAIKRKH